jgi:putative ABC transport system permease protein
METLIQDVRYGFRMLVKNPGFTAVAALSLALGIGANTTIFTLINAVFLSPIPVEDPKSVVGVFTTDSQIKGGFNDYMPISNPNFIDYRDSNSVLAGIAAHGFLAASLVGGSGQPEQVIGEIASANFFSLLGVKPALGRAFRPDEDARPGGAPVAVLSHALWTRRFGSDPGVVGRTITLNGHPFTVVGVTPAGFKGISVLGGPNLWVPMSMYQQALNGFMLDNFMDRRALLFNVVARLKPGVSIEQAEAELKTIGKRLEKDYPEPNRGRNVSLLTLSQSTINPPGFRRYFVLAGGLLMTVVGLVLLIACANVANLLLARATSRRREVAIRISLGAGRLRLIRQLMTESLLLALLGGGAGLLIASWARDLLLAFRPPQTFFDLPDLALDGRVLGFTLLVSVLTGVLFGLVPALQASRPDLVVELKDRSVQPMASRRSARLRGALVAGQVALSLTALIGAGLFLRSLRNTQKIDPGFESKQLLALEFDLGAQGLDQTHGLEFERRVLEEVSRLPGLRSAALSAALPIGGGGLGRTVFPEGQEPATGAVGQFTTVNSIGSGYFETLGIAVRRGRELAETDREGTPRVAVINEAMAKQFWPNQDALGKRFKFYGDETFLEVVGIAQTAKLFSLSEDPQPIAYVPIRQAYETTVVLNVRTEGDPAALLETVRRKVQALDPTMPLTNVKTVRALIDETLWAPQMSAMLLTIFALVALVLAGIGIYGVMSYAVGQRTQEFGIRMALGAKPGDVLSLVLRQGMILVAAGVAAGLLISLTVTRLVAALLVNVSATDPVTFAGIAILFGMVAALAGYVPARRATKIDPMIALRYE